MSPPGYLVLHINISMLLYHLCPCKQYHKCSPSKGSRVRDVFVTISSCSGGIQCDHLRKTLVLKVRCEWYIPSFFSEHDVGARWVTRDSGSPPHMRRWSSSWVLDNWPLGLECSLGNAASFLPVCPQRGVQPRSTIFASGCTLVYLWAHTLQKSTSSLTCLRNVTEITEFWKVLVIAIVLSGTWDIYMFSTPSAFSYGAGIISPVIWIFKHVQPKIIFSRISI